MSKAAELAKFIGDGTLGTDTGDAFNSDSILRLGRSGDRAFLQFKTDTSNNSGILFGDETDDVRHSIQFEPTDNVITFNGNTAETMRIDANGHITKPLQPAFLVKPSSSQLNLTVGSANAVVFGTEIFDQNGDFASNTFTAPVTGKYQLNLDIFFTNIDSAGTELGIKFETSNREHNIFIEPDHAFASDGNHSYVMATLADMDANDTVTVKVTPVGGHTDVDVHTHTKFSGYLVA